MNTPAPTNACRAPIESTLTIHAPVEAVWDALCTADGLCAWFPLDARVRPGVGGSVFTSWRNEYAFDMPIRVWEPGARVSWQWGMHEHDQPTPSVVDFFLESRAGGTVLRMVHHGFSADADWNQMYDATVRGWDFELHSLKTYLDHHRGKPRHVAHVRSPVGALSGAQALQRLLAPGALLERGSLAGLAPGDRFDVTLTGGQRLIGCVRASMPGAYMCMDIDNLEHAVMRLDIESCNPGTGPMLWVWLNAWGDHAALVQSLNATWLRVMRACFGRALAIGERPA